MSIWRTSDGRPRVLLALGLIYLLSGFADLYRYGFNNLRSLEPFIWAGALFASLPLQEPPRRTWPLSKQLRTPSGVISFGLMSVACGLILWRLIHK